MDGFQFLNRNPGHWDVVHFWHGRMFRIRGDIGDVVVFDERPVKGEAGREPAKRFKTVAAATSYITDILMFEPLASDGDNLVDSSGNQLLAIAKD